MRQLRRALQAVPQLLLVQPEQLSYDVAFALSLVPLILAGLVFFRQDAVLIFAISFLAGVVCLLALQLARLTLGLPAWVGHKANHPLVASLLIACLLPPRTPLWLAAGGVILFVLLDTVIWPQLQRIMLHPALIVFGLLFIAQRQLGVSFVNPFDGTHRGDLLTLWYQHLWFPLDPVKLYVGNVPGPVGATSAAAILVGLTYLWYARKVSLGIIVGFLVGVGIPAVVIGSDVAFQLSAGPALFLAGYIAADRRRVALAEPFTFAFGLAAGALTMVLRGYGQGQEAAWQSLLLLSTVVTVFLRVRALLTGTSRRPGGGTALRTLALASGRPQRRPAEGAPIREGVRQPAMAIASRGASVKGTPASLRGFDSGTDSNDLVREMRNAASRGPLKAASGNPVLIAISLILVNPIGLVMTWSSRSLGMGQKRLLTVVSVAWYVAAAGLVLAVTHVR